MKMSIYLLIIVTSLFLASCDSNPDQEICDVLTDELLLGTWNVNGLTSNGQITLLADGHLIDDNNLIIPDGMGASVKTWAREGVEMYFGAGFNVTIGTDSVLYNYPILEFVCDTISFGFITSDFTLTK